MAIIAPASFSSRLSSDRSLEANADFARDLRHPAHLFARRLERDRNVAEILDHQRVDAFVAEDLGLRQRGIEHPVEPLAAIPRARRERAELDHPDDGLPTGAYRGEERIHQAATRFSPAGAELKISEIALTSIV